MADVNRRNAEFGPRRFRRYPEYKESSVEWLGVIPAHWGVKRLKFAAQTVAGQSPPSAAVGDGVDGLPFLQGNAEFGPLSPTPRHVCDSAPKRAQAGDILLSVRAPVGAMNVADQTYGIGRGLCAIRPTAAMDRSFCFYEIMAIRSLLDAVGKGSTYDAVTASDVGDLPMLLPHPDEQQAVAALLDREIAKIDALVAKKERLIELLQEKRTALITRAVTRGLDPTVPMQDSGVEWLGEIPTHWEVVGSKVLFTHRKEGARHDDQQLTASQKHGVIPQRQFIEAEGRSVVQVVTGADILKHVEPNDFVMSMRSFQGGLEHSNYRGRISSAYVIVRPSDRVDCGYFSYAFKSTTYIQALQSTSDLVRDGQALRFSNFVQVPLPLISLQEQKTIASYLDQKVGQLDRLGDAMARAIQHLNEYRTALISAAVTGKIDVRNEAA